MGDQWPYTIEEKLVHGQLVKVKVYGEAPPFSSKDLKLLKKTMGKKTPINSYQGSSRDSSEQLNSSSS